MLKERWPLGRLLVNKELPKLSRHLFSNNGAYTVKRLHKLPPAKSYLISISHESELQYLATNLIKLQLLRKQLELALLATVRKFDGLIIMNIFIKVIGSTLRSHY